MRNIIGLFVAAFIVNSTATAEEKPPFASRTTQFLTTPQHTHEAKGGSDRISRYAIPSVESHEAGGYIGGGRVFRGSAGGPNEGTFGYDYVGFGRRPGRIFLGFFGESAKQQGLLPKYNADGPRVKDLVAAQPFRRAVKEAKAENAEKAAGKKE